MTRLLLAIVLVVATLGLLTPPAQARGEDVCPEPNDAFQAACYLGPAADALGFLSHPGDVDAYRVEVLDFGAGLQVELADRPLPYRLHLANWNGEVMASDADGTVAATLPLPGSYYLFVDAPDGQVSADRPYRIVPRLTYPGPPPQVLRSTDFASEADETFSGSDPNADYSKEGGRFVVTLKRPGTSQESQHALGTWGPTASDFTLTVDSRIVGGSADPTKGGYSIFFRSQIGYTRNEAVPDQPGFRPGDRGYYIEVSASGQVRLWVIENQTDRPLTGWIRTGAATPNFGVNRMVIQATGPTIRVLLNGREALTVEDATHTSGRFAFGALSWAEPNSARFDNVLLTTPGPG
jgi:hypothetical protein